MAAFSKAGFFDGSTYTASDFAKVMYSLNGDGIDIRYGNQLACSASGLNITVDSGAAWLQGYFGWNDNAVTITETSGTRKDYLCVHVDPDNSIFELAIVEGTSSAYPTLSGNDYMPVYGVIVSGSTVTLEDFRTFCYGNTGVSKTYFDVVTGTLTAANYPDGALLFKPTLS